MHMQSNGRNLPGSSNSLIRLPLLKSCSSSFASHNLEQYFLCSVSSFQCASEQCVGQPQSGHSNLTAFGCALVCSCIWLSDDAHTGHGASWWMASPLARIAGKGEIENGWNRLSSARIGTGSVFFAGFERLRRLNIVLEVAGGLKARAL